MSHKPTYTELEQKIRELAAEVRRLKSEKALEESETHLQTLIRTIPDLVWLKDPHGVYITCNPKFERFFGATESEIRGKTDYDFLDKELADFFREKDRAAMEAGRPISNEEEIVFAADGHKELLETIKTPMVDAGGNLVGVLGIGRDITDRKRIEKELAVEDIPEWNPAQHSLKEIKTAGLRARDVVRQLLSFSRKSEQKKSPIQIHPIVKESVQLLRATIPKSIEIRSRIPSNLGTIVADPTQIHQVIINICTNAVHAMEACGDTLEIIVKQVELNEETASGFYQVAPGSYIQLTVTDNGCGIAPENRDRIFDPYFSTKAVDKGSGIGLSVVSGIVKNHDGAISVYSEPDVGTTVKVLFPVADEKPAKEKIFSEALRRGTERVLLVDDEAAIIKMGRLMLERLGYGVEAFSDPKAALDAFQSAPDRFDLVITDMTMPQMTGDRLAKELLKIRSDIPIILCTGFSEKIDGEKAGDAGIQKYIEKPLNKQELSDAIREVLSCRTG